jgi:hypothetical protein
MGAAMENGNGIAVTIQTDAAGLKSWKAEHARHFHRGPDLLQFATGKKVLGFQTTYAPGADVGSLRCHIAQNLITLSGLNIPPHDWLILVQNITARNVKYFLQKKLRDQDAKSDQARQSYEKTGDPEIVVSFIKESSTGAAFNEKWIQDAIAAWWRSDRKDLIRAAFLTRRGERSCAHTRAIERRSFRWTIENRRRAGKSLKEALIEESERTGGGISEAEIMKLKNKYETAKRIKTEIAVSETAEALTMTAFPAVVKIGEHPLFGTSKITIQKK